MAWLMDSDNIAFFSSPTLRQGINSINVVGLTQCEDVQNTQRALDRIGVDHTRDVCAHIYAAHVHLKRAGKGHVRYDSASMF